MGGDRKSEVDRNAERGVGEFERLSGRGDSKRWRFDRDEIHERTAESQNPHPGREERD